MVALRLCRGAHDDHRLPSHVTDHGDAHSFSNQLLPNVLGRRLSLATNVTQPRPSIPCGARTSLVWPPTALTWLCRASRQSRSTHTTHLFSKALSQPFFRPFIFTAPSRFAPKPVQVALKLKRAVSLSGRGRGSSGPTLGGSRRATR